MKLVLLPGLDGTAELFAPFIEALPDELEPIAVSYPAGEAWGYDELFDFVKNKLPQNEDFLLLGESFSGPLALMLASEPSVHCKALVMACSFRHNPRPMLTPLARLLNDASVALLPKALISLLLTHGAKNRRIAADVQAAVKTVPAKTLRARVRAIDALSSSKAQKHVDLPSLYLQATHDRVVPASSCKSLQLLMPHMKIKRVDGPHCLLQVNPQASVGAIVEFLQSEHLLSCKQPSVSSHDHQPST